MFVVKEAELDRVGIFIYSKEEGTSSLKIKKEAADKSECFDSIRNKNKLIAQLMLRDKTNWIPPEKYNWIFFLLVSVFLVMAANWRSHTCYSIHLSPHCSLYPNLAAAAATQFAPWGSFNSDPI